MTYGWQSRCHSSLHRDLHYRRWLQLRFDFDSISISIRLPLDGHSTAYEKSLNSHWRMCYALPESALRSLDFVVVRFLMKLFRTVNNEIIHDCCSYLKFSLSSELLQKRRVKFISNFMQCTGVLQRFSIKT